MANSIKVSKMLNSEIRVSGTIRGISRSASETDGGFYLSKLIIYPIYLFLLDAFTQTMANSIKVSKMLNLSCKVFFQMAEVGKNYT